MAVVSDRKIAVDAANDGTADYFTGEVLSANDYYAFGATMPGRSFTSSSYRYGYNGMEKDDEVKGDGNSYTTEWRQYDPRLGRWLAIDPEVRKFPAASPYLMNMNSPFVYIDNKGDCPVFAIPYVAYGIYAVLAGAVSITAGVVVHDAIKDAQQSTYEPLREAPPLVLNPTKPVAVTHPEKAPEKTPENKPNSKPDPSPLNPPVSPLDKPEKEKDENTITLYRGVSSYNPYNSKTRALQYTQALRGVATPLPQLDEDWNFEPHQDMDEHAAGDNYSIWTSWTSRKSTAEVFAKGPGSNNRGVILTKQFKIGEVFLNTSESAKLMQEAEYLAPGVVTGASVEYVIPKKDGQ